jgi:hypothetical protein
MPPLGKQILTGIPTHYAGQGYVVQNPDKKPLDDKDWEDCDTAEFITKMVINATPNQLQTMLEQL